MYQTIRFWALTIQATNAHCLKFSTTVSSLLPFFINCQKPLHMDKLNCKFGNEAIKYSSQKQYEYLHNRLEKMYIINADEKNVNCVTVKPDQNSMKTVARTKSTNKTKYKKIRRWTEIKGAATNWEESFLLRILSFNILAQDLLETHLYLYTNHNKEDLSWEKRRPLILQEIVESEAQIICLQEVQENHLKDFLISLEECGFDYLFKKRTNDKTDGLLLLYKENLFNLLELSKLELYQTGIELLGRDNVALIAKFSLKSNPEIKFVVATTHLLYNPRRNDIRLGQVQLLLAEIERISFVKNTVTGPEYLPIVLSGDFNLVPHSGVYNFITQGSLEFEGKGRDLENCGNRCLTNSLIPPHLYITDECQHFNVLSKRLSGKGSGKVMLRNAENKYFADLTLLEPEKKSFVDSNTTAYQKIEIIEGHYATFSSGLLTHPFQFKSIYNHQNEEGLKEATTFQKEWINVDYIFYRNMNPIDKLRLPTVSDCWNFIKAIPNSFVGSDHLATGATFQIKIK